MRKGGLPIFESSMSSSGSVLAPAAEMGLSCLQIQRIHLKRYGCKLDQSMTLFFSFIRDDTDFLEQ